MCSLLLISIGYASLSGRQLIISGTAFANADDMKVYYTGRVVEENVSESYVKIKAEPKAYTRDARVNISGLAKQGDFASTILEIENGSELSVPLLINIDTDVPVFLGDRDLFDISVIMCDESGRQIPSTYGVWSGEKTYVKLYVELLNDPIEHKDATITTKIKVTRQENEPIYVDRYICQEEPIHSINKFSWPLQSQGLEVFLANKPGQTVQAATGASTLNNWHAIFAQKTENETYKINDIIFSDEQLSKGSLVVPDNGFILIIYSNVVPSSTLRQIDLDDNQIIVNFNNGGSIESYQNDILTNVLNNEAKPIGTFSIISGMREDDDIELNLPDGLGDIFHNYYAVAEYKLKRMSLDDKIAQMYIVGANTDNSFLNMTSYKFGGYLFFSSSFRNKTMATVIEEIAGYKSAVEDIGGLPLLTAIDEEGEKVSRLGHARGNGSDFLEYNGIDGDNIVINEDNTRDFRNSADLFISINDWSAVEQDLWSKHRLLSQLGINVNFAPDVDITSNTSAYIYERTFRQNAEITKMFARKVIQASKTADGFGVSCTLKHFPGYGSSSKDTHSTFLVDNRQLSELEENDLLPFIEGIRAGAECIMVTHNLITSMESEGINGDPASISKDVHDYLRNELNYSGIIITDSISMDAIHNTYTSRDAIIKAINSGNDMICISLESSGKNDAVETVSSTGTRSIENLTYRKLISYVKNAVEDGIISEDTINLAVRRIIAWKMYKGLITK